MGILFAMNQYVPPIRPGETYSQGFWHAVIAAALYLIGSVILMGNMLGYFLGHYPQHFDLDDDQRTLILQTMMFFFWLAGGAAVFSKVCGWSYADALYFCDVTVLTIGFGDFVGVNDTGRGLVFPYSVIGIIFLGLMINSIRKFAAGMSKDKIIKKHQLNERERTFGRSVTNEKEIRERLGLPPRRDSSPRRLSSAARRQSAITSLKSRRNSLDQYGHFDVHGRTITFHEKKKHAGGGGRGGAGRAHKPKAPLSRDAKLQQRAEGKSAHAKRAHRREKLVLLKEEKDRFEAMREIQAHTHKFEQYAALTMAVFAFGILWCIGALIFMVAEQRIQGLSYLQALYFCYVSLLTIGYGDFSPKSNAGKPFFVVWSLVAIPTMTILISEMGDTVVAAINRGTFTLADWTVMPREGIWKDFLENHPKIKDWLERKTKEREAKKRLEHGFALQNPDEESIIGGTGNGRNPPTLEKLAEEKPEITDHELARKLAIAIKKTANDLRAEVPKKYSYEEWVEFTRLIRFSSCDRDPEEMELAEEEEGLVEWDWIGEDSPMLADVTEAEWVLDRLCESLNRYTRKQAKVFSLSILH
jgi:potassium channel subfamily K